MGHLSNNTIHRSMLAALRLNSNLVHLPRALNMAVSHRACRRSLPAEVPRRLSRSRSRSRSSLPSHHWRQVCPFHAGFFSISVAFIDTLGGSQPQRRMTANAPPGGQISMGQRGPSPVPCST